MAYYAAMSQMADFPAPADLARPSNAYLLLRIVLPTLASFGFGSLFLLAFFTPSAQISPVVEILSLGFLASIAFLLDSVDARVDRRRAILLLDVPLPDSPDLWHPNSLPLSAHGRLALARAAPVPHNWPIGHDGQYIYVVERAGRRWRRLARKPR